MSALSEIVYIKFLFEFTNVKLDNRSYFQEQFLVGFVILANFVRSDNPNVLLGLNDVSIFGE